MPSWKRPPSGGGGLGQAVPRPSRRLHLRARGVPDHPHQGIQHPGTQGENWRLVVEIKIFSKLR